MTFSKAFDNVILVEGGYSDDPYDSGGQTKYGITLAVARAYGYTDTIKDMPLSIAEAIYRKRYWDAMHLDTVDALYPSVAHELFDSAVNVGTGRAGTWLQRSLNVLNQSGSLYADMVVDGIVGPVTIASLERYVMQRGNEGEGVLLAALNSLQGAFYIELAEAREKDETFVYGWIRARVA